ncbi:MAG: amino acid permease [Methanomassiliicoccus sp.]|nr:amino acid permease [Methanomassiliicoccus sp.]
MAELKRGLGLVGAVDVGVGAIIGAGIFVLSGVAAGLAGPSVILSFILAGVTAFLTALSSAEMSSFITEAGGSYIYARKAFGPGWGFLVGWTKSFDYIVGAAAVAIGFATYFVLLFNLTGQVSVTLIAAILPLAFLLLNLRGVREASGANNLLVVLKVLALIVFIAVGAGYLISSGNFSHYSPFFPLGVSGTVAASAVIFFAFVGFNTITVMSEEVKDPQRTVPRAIILAFVISILLYIGVSSVEVGLVDWQQLAGSAAPLDIALRQATSNEYILAFVSVSALFATASVVMSSMLGGSRALFAMGRNGVLPRSLAHLSGRGVPSRTVIIAGLAMAAVVVLSQGDLTTLASVFNFGTLLTFLFINLSMLRLRKTMPDARRSFIVPLFPLTPVLGIGSCLVLMAFLNLEALLIAAVWISIGYIVYRRSRRSPGEIRKVGG